MQFVQDPNKAKNHQINGMEIDECEVLEATTDSYVKEIAEMNFWLQ